MRTFLVGGTVYTPTEVIENGVVVTEGGRIVNAGSTPSLAHGEGLRVDVSGLRVVPGLIDLHLHGFKGADVMAGGIAGLASKAAGSGVTSFLATTLTASIDELKEVIKNVAAERDRDGAGVLGLHLEGPYLSPLQPGMMDVSLFRAFSWPEMRELIEMGKGAVKMVTLAPEIDGAITGISQLQRMGVIASVGHSHATFAEMKLAVDAGLRHATHVFNAMRGFHHREPGVVGAVLHFPEVVAQFIADGQHLHPASVELLLRTKGVDQLALISDATPLAGLPPGEYSWQGVVLEVKGGRAQVKRWLDDGSRDTKRQTANAIGGSVNMLSYGVRYLVESAGWSLADAMRTASETPARVLGLGHKKGRLAPGWDADIAVFDEHFECRLAMVGGKIVYRATRT